MYKVGDFEHHVPESIDKAFKDEVKKAGKSPQPIGDPYSVSSDRHQEACDNPIEANRIFHPPNEVWTEAIKEVLVQVYEVSQSEGDNFIVHCPLDLIDALANEVKFNEAQSSEIDDYFLTIREYRDNCKNPPDNKHFIEIDADFKNYDPLASLFSKELNKRNIKTVKDTTMTTQTQTKPQDKTSVNAEEENLMKYLGSCTRAFLDELILTFNDEEALKLYQYAHSTKKKQNVMYQIVTKDLEKGSEQLTAIKDFHDYVQGSAKDVEEAQDTMKSYRAGLQGKVNDIGTKFVINEQTKDCQKEILGQMKCNKDIEEGLKGYGKAVVAGHIIGKEKQVVAAADHIAVEVSSKVIKYQDLSDKSLEGVKKVTRNTNKGINKIVQTLLDKEGNLNAKADSLLAPQPDNVQESVTQPVNN